MQELTTLLTAITPGDWLLVKNEDAKLIAGGHTLYVYARSAVSGRETVVSFPVAVGSR